MGALLLLVACGNDRGRHVLPPAIDAGANASSVAKSTSGPLPLVARPRSITRADGILTIDRTTRISIEDGAEARGVAERLARWFGLQAPTIDVGPPGAAEPATGIVLRLTKDGPPREVVGVDVPRSPNEEAYSLDVSTTRAVVRARSAAGLFYGAQTLAQLAGARHIGIETPALGEGGRWTVPCVSLEDAPQFAYRAMHLDVARHFFSKEVVERWIDLLSFYRFNVFHWHLTDDQGFRIEVKSHPELTAIGGRDGFYTQDQAREVVSHARERFVTVVPEIEMPGHARAILAAHPELSCTGKRQDVPRTWGVFDDVLCAGNEKTYELLADVLAEVTSVFPSRLVHLGGDEVRPTRWAACSKCRAAMKASNTTTAIGLEGVFMARATSMLARLGRRALVWDEALSPSLPKDAVVLAWQSKDRGLEAARQGYDVVMAPHEHVYFNFHQSRTGGEPGHDGFLPWTKVHAFDPVPAGLEEAHAGHVLGGEGALWTEYIETAPQLDTMAMPRMAALADALWSGGSSSGSVEEQFTARFGAQLPLLDASDVHYFVDPPTGLRRRRVFIDGEKAALSLEPPRLFPGGVVRWTRDGSEPTASSPRFEGPVRIDDTASFAAALFLANGRTSAVVHGQIVKERPRPPSTATRFEGATYTYFEGDFRKLPDFGKVTAKARGRVPSIGLAELERALGGRMRKERFAAAFDGFIEAPSDGVYRLIARADDGVRVVLDGETVLEDDGVHDARTSDGEIALQRGHHAVRVLYFQAVEGKELDVKIELPDGTTAPLLSGAVATTPE